jgi:flagellin
VFTVSWRKLFVALHINTNLSSLKAQRNLATGNDQLSKTLERLASGLRINRAADDAAGLAVSEKLRTQIKGFAQATNNAQDGVQLVQTAEGGLEQISGVLQRMRELSIQSANDSLVNADRQKIQTEIEQLRAEITRISQTTEYNTRQLLNGSIQSSLFDFQDARAVLTNTIRVGDANLFPFDIRDFAVGVQSLALNATVDQAISLKVVNFSTTLSQIGLEVRSSVFGVLTQIQDVPLLASSSFGIPLLGPGPTATMLTLDINKGGFVSGAVDRSTPLSSLMLVERLGTVNAGTFTVTVGSTAYNVAINPGSDSINSILANINGLSNATHTFNATYNDLANTFQLSVTRTANPQVNTYSSSSNYSSTPPAAYAGGAPTPAPYPALTLPALGTEFASAVDFPNLNALGNNSNIAIGGGAFAAGVLGGVNTLAGNNRNIISYATNVYTGTPTYAGSNSNYNLTTAVDFSQIQTSSVSQSASGGFIAGLSWAAQGFLFGVDNLNISVTDSTGAAQAVPVVVSDAETVATTLTNIQNALNGIAAAGDIYTVGFGAGNTLQISHTVTQNYAAGVASTSRTQAFIPANAPIPFGGSAGPNNFGPGSPVIAPFFSNPGGVAPEFDLTLNFSGNTNLENALYLSTVADNADTRVNTYRGTVNPLGNDNYTLTTTQTETHNAGSNSVQSSSRVGGPFNLSEADLGKEMVVQIFGERKEVREDRALTLQIGANEGQFLKLGVDEMSARALRIESLNIVGSNDADSHLKAQNAIGMLTEALDYVNLNRSRLGAYQNRLEYTIQNLQISKENLTASESRIRDTDIASETAHLTRAQILVQAGTAVLSQANISLQSALNLLRA